MQGYLAGHLAPEGDASRVLVVRQKDLLRRQDAIVYELARLGLPRNAVDFAPLEALLAGYQNTTRQETLRREAEALSTLAGHVKRTIIVRLVSRGCERHMQALGYAMPVKHSAADSAPASWLEAETLLESARSFGSASTPVKKKLAE